MVAHGLVPIVQSREQQVPAMVGDLGGVENVSAMQRADLDVVPAQVAADVLTQTSSIR